MWGLNTYLKVTTVAAGILTISAAGAVLSDISPVATKSLVARVEGDLAQVGGDFYNSQRNNLYSMQLRTEDALAEALKAGDSVRAAELRLRLKSMEDEIMRAKANSFMFEQKLIRSK